MNPGRVSSRAGRGAENEEGSVDLEASLAPGLAAGERLVSLKRIYMLTIANYGIAAAWALEMAITTPYFASVLESGPVLSHFVWMLGPLSGLVVQPLVGRLSDRCTSRLGRRRPFIVAGAIGTFAGMIFFCNAQPLAKFFFPKAAHNAALALAVGAFAVMDLSINTAMLPVRALQGDLVPERQQHAMQSAIVVMAGLGDFSVNMVVERLADPVEHLQWLCLVVATVYVCTSAAMFFISREQQYQLPPQDLVTEPLKRTTWGARVRQAPAWVGLFFKSIPPWLWRVGSAMALGFFAFFCIMPNSSAWLGSSVLQGDAEGLPKAKKLYEMGIVAFGKAGAVRALLIMTFAALYPRLLKYVAASKLLGIACLTYAVIMLTLANTRNLFWGQFAVASFAIPLASLHTVPTAMTLEKSTKRNRGTHLGILNIFCTVPQLLDTVYSGWVSKMYGEAWVMRIGAVWSLLAAMFAFFVLREEDKTIM